MTTVERSPAFGVVLFDGGQLGCGWAAVKGGPAVRVSGHGELDTGVLWLSNLDYTVFRESGMLWNGWLRHSGYLRVGLDRIVDEWGLGVVDPPTQATYLSGIFAHAMEIAKRINVTKFTSPTLYHECAQVLSSPEYPEPKAALVTKHALQEFTRSSLRIEKGTRLLTLQRPRGVHVGDLLRCPIPVGPWRYVGEGQLPPMNRLRWLESLGLPVFAQVRVHGVEYVGDVLGFGIGARDADGKPLRREWVTGPELLVLREFADVDISSAWIGSGFSTLPFWAEVEEFVFSPPAQCSWAAGIVAENLWAGATLREQSPPRGVQPRTSWRAAWMRADDRMKMFMLAQKLITKGWHVYSYGIGAVRLLAPRRSEEMAKLLADAFSLGLEPPLSVTCVTPIQDAVWGGEAVAASAAMLKASGHQQVLLRLNALPCMSREDKARLFSELMGGPS